MFAALFRFDEFVPPLDVLPHLSIGQGRQHLGSEPQCFVMSHDIRFNRRIVIENFVTSFDLGDVPSIGKLLAVDKCTEGLVVGHVALHVDVLRFLTRNNV